MEYKSSPNPLSLAYWELYIQTTEASYRRRDRAAMAAEDKGVADGIKSYLCEQIASVIHRGTEKLPRISRLYAEAHMLNNQGSISFSRFHFFVRVLFLIRTIYFPLGSICWSDSCSVILFIDCGSILVLVSENVDIVTEIWYKKRRLKSVFS